MQDSFIENINLYENEFKNKCYFKYICFGDKKSKESKINLSNANFQNDIYFDNSIFYSYADFHACEFNKIASFYGVTFDKTPNFSQVIFKGNLNAVNTNLNFIFDNLQEKINQEYEKFNEDKNEQYQKSLDKFANDFRDSFRVFKNALIKDNNLLEASNFHKYELYCKEIELNSNDILSKYERDEVFDKLSLRLKQKVDWCLLLFYRKLSDHHTDLLKVINNCFILIAVYFICIFNFTNIDFLEIKEINIFSFLKSFSFYGDDKIVAAAKIFPLSCLLLLFLTPIIIFMASLYYSDKQKRSVIFKKIKFKVGKFLLIAIIFAVMQLMLFVINFGLFVPLIKIVVFLGIFFLVICIDSLYLRYYCVILSYINFIIVIVYYPIVLNPLIGKVLNDKIKIEDPLVMVMTFTYTILMFLVLFSLQKTARKNSIVPS
ncbi:pentapeptide repeat-containing protein [Campylobacter sp. CNRCH_2016_0050h]|uniref:pentapeptide repeat-containing protein n=1 Tax=Campylobacter sp. CNRCH_2016_0050h TaxID=2911608 RepID=UPI0021E656BA|nr:pentapeptide repeat-containing protein [Campylobacter sp. CNRCH_2016_0050h]MCV3456819.1 pentapeptide repeat-containing protein [Campylobacter sp. CNRCH_2016_0050h]